MVIARQPHGAKTRLGLAGLALALGIGSASAGDSLYGIVTAVKSSDLITLDYGSGSYDIRIAGVVVPDDRAASDEAAAFVSKLVVGKNVRLRFDGRTSDGEMVGRIFTDDPQLGILDVGLETIRSGLAMPDAAYRGYVYGEMDRAVAEARQSQRGIWGTAPKQ